MSNIHEEGLDLSCIYTQIWRVPHFHLFDMSLHEFPGKKITCYWLPIHFLEITIFMNKAYLTRHTILSPIMLCNCVECFEEEKEVGFAWKSIIICDSSHTLWIVFSVKVCFVHDKTLASFIECGPSATCRWLRRSTNCFLKNRKTFLFLTLSLLRDQRSRS